MDLKDKSLMGEVTPALMKLIGGKVPSRKEGKKETMKKSILKGERNDALFKKGCSLLGTGLGENEIHVLLNSINSEQCRPPLDESEVRKIVQSVVQYENELPTIVTKNAQQRDVIEQAMECLVEANKRELTIFQFGSELVRMRQQETPELERLDAASLAWHLAHEANWRNPGNRNAGPPMEIVKAVLGAPLWPFPFVKGIIKTPMFSKTGALYTQPGYNPDTEYWYYDDLPEPVGQISDTPTGGCK